MYINTLLFFLSVSENPCDNVDILKAFYFVSQLVGLSLKIIPVIVIILLSYDMFRNVVEGNEGLQKKNFSLFIRRIILLVFLFIVPNIVGVVLDVASDSMGYSDTGFLKCLNVDQGIINSQLKTEESKCVSEGNSWNSNTQSCDLKSKVNSDSKKLVNKIKAINSSAKKYKLDNIKEKGSLGSSNSEHPSSKKYPIAEASLMMALPTQAEATAPSYGSDLYVYVYDHVIQNQSAYRTGKKKEASTGSTRYRSCSEATATAVRWSGCDIDFPRSPSAQRNYALSSSKWKRVNWGGDYSKLEPGDVFVDSNHSMMYVGKKLLHEYFPNAPKNFNITEASYNSDYNHKAQALHIDYKNLNTARWLNNVFRCVNKDYSTKYNDVMLSS